MDMSTPWMAKASPTATQMIRTDHAAAMALFHKVRPDTGEGTKAAAVRALCTAIEIHARLEEEIVYPAFRAAGIAPELLDDSGGAHQAIHEALQRVRACQGPGRQAEQDEAVMQMMNAVLHHVADEETRLLPEAERLLGQQRLSDLGVRMTKRRMALMRPQARQLMADKVRAMPVKSGLMAATVLGLLALGVSAVLRSRDDRLDMHDRWA